ncbi:hypothetical protein [Candidatus Magnetobacterium casense]|uniref:Secreted protein n=1 Tax=Candidatus Magnetobacterium casense TaxID=1455061 RepID=A0ABS6S360_9BACT|nr:hypothetical protein [Candidatus Magnetobacterium casensis]MBV6343292.1 hypothetical protein [Candidatus Magnetobacterium casensis]
MEAWAALQFAFALVVAIGCIALIIGQLYKAQRAEEQSGWNELRQKIASIR